MYQVETSTRDENLNIISPLTENLSSFKKQSTEVFYKKVFLEVSQNSQERAQACNFIKKETRAQVLSCEFCEISKNNYFEEGVQTTALVSFQNLF